MLSLVLLLFLEVLCEWQCPFVSLWLRSQTIWSFYLSSCLFFLYQRCAFQYVSFVFVPCKRMLLSSFFYRLLVMLLMKAFMKYKLAWRASHYLSPDQNSTCVKWQQGRPAGIKRLISLGTFSCLIDVYYFFLHAYFDFMIILAFDLWKVVYFPRVVKVADIVSVLRSNKHNGFPVSCSFIYFQVLPLSLWFLTNGILFGIRWLMIHKMENNLSLDSYFVGKHEK